MGGAGNETKSEPDDVADGKCYLLESIFGFWNLIYWAMWQAFLEAPSWGSLLLEVYTNPNAMLYKQT